jgi:hypothetical protein
MRDVTLIRRSVVWLLGSTVGVVLLAAPDDGPRLVGLSATHGLSAVDMAGLVVLVVSWLPVAALIWTRRRLLYGRRARAAAILAGSGAVLLALTVGFDLGSAWLVAVSMLVAGQILALHLLYAAGAGMPRGQAL